MMPVTKLNEISEEAIHRLVDDFYAKVRADSGLGPILAHAFPGDWETHLSLLREFWSSVLLGSGDYKGNPAVIHRHMVGIEMELLDRWFALFDQTSRQIFVDNLADTLLEKAMRIAESRKLPLFNRPVRPWPKRPK